MLYSPTYMLGDVFNPQKLSSALFNKIESAYQIIRHVIYDLPIEIEALHMYLHIE